MHFNLPISFTPILSLLLVGLLLYPSCTHHQPSDDVPNASVVSKDTSSTPTDSTTITPTPPPPLPPFISFDRTTIQERLANKIAQQKPLVVHIFVPLCDNEHQGILPVSASLGNGFDLQSNLYWGAAYGVKSYFKRKTNWQLESSQLNISDTVLERVVFSKTINQTKVYIIADAYAGDQMRACLEDYFAALADQKQDRLQIDSQNIPIYAHADLLIFNGHNGLMDTQVPTITNRKARPKDAVVIACISDAYFNNRLNYVHAYPLVMTTNLLAPEAYVLEGIIEAWAKQQCPKQIHLEAAKAYHKYQKCGIKGAKRLFRTGWGAEI